jgi:hypothetical protein
MVCPALQIFSPYYLLLNSTVFMKNKLLSMKCAQQSIVKFYCFVVQTLPNMFWALQCPSSGACQTAVAASGFRMNVEVEVFSAVVEPLVSV